MPSTSAPAGSDAEPAPPSAPSVSPAIAEMPAVSFSKPASASAYSWLGPPRPLPRTVTVSSPPERIATRLPLRARLQRQPRMIGGDLARLAFEIGAEIDGLVAIVLASFTAASSDCRGRAISSKLRMRKGGIACLAAFVAGIVERAADRIVDLEPVFGDDGARIGQRRRIGHGRTRGDRRRIVARHVGDRERQDLACALAGARQPPALDPRQMFANGVDLADRRARAQQRARRTSASARKLMPSAGAIQFAEPPPVSSTSSRSPASAVRGELAAYRPRPSARPRQAWDGRPRPPGCAASARHGRGAWWRCRPAAPDRASSVSR